MVEAIEGLMEDMELTEAGVGECEPEVISSELPRGSMGTGGDPSLSLSRPPTPLMYGLRSDCTAVNTQTMYN